MQIKTNEIKFSSIKFDGRKIMAYAHSQARVWSMDGSSYRANFAKALKAAWESAKSAIVFGVCHLGRIAQRTLKGMVKMVKTETTKLIKPEDMIITGWTAKSRRADYAWLFDFVVSQDSTMSSSRAWKACRDTDEILKRVRYLSGEQDNQKSQQAAAACAKEQGWAALWQAVRAKAGQIKAAHQDAANMYSKQLRSEIRRDKMRAPVCCFAGNVKN